MTASFLRLDASNRGNPDCRRIPDVPLPRFPAGLVPAFRGLAAPLPVSRRNLKNLSPFIESVNARDIAGLDNP